MNTPIKIADAAGKTISRIYHNWPNSHCAIIYTDGTFSFLQASRSWGEGAEIEDGNPTESELVDMGLIDRAEYDRRCGLNAAKHQEFIEHSERQQYERLKAKFEAQS